MTKTPPFLAGAKAYLNGLPITANPYPEGWKDGDEYPGEFQNWRARWEVERAITRHIPKGA